MNSRTWFKWMKWSLGRSNQILKDPTNLYDNNPPLSYFGDDYYSIIVLIRKNEYLLCKLFFAILIAVIKYTIIAQF